MLLVDTAEKQFWGMQKTPESIFLSFLL